MDRGVWWDTVHKESDRTKQLALSQEHVGGFPGGSVVKNPPASAGDMNLIPDQEDPTCH